MFIYICIWVHELCQSFTILIDGTLLLQKPSRALNRIPPNIRYILPIHNPRIPLTLRISLANPFPQFLMANQPSIGRIGLRDRLADHNFLAWDPTLDDLVHGGAGEDGPGLDEEGFVGVVFCVALVVELDVVEVDCVAYCFVDGYVGAVFVEFLFEVGGLWGVGYQVIGELSAELRLELDQPVLALPGLHRRIVLPVNVNAIQIIPVDKSSQLVRTGNRIDSRCRRKFRSPESADQNFDPIIVVLFLKELLDLVLCTAEWAISPEVFYGIRPDVYNVQGTTRIAPESKSNIVVNCRSSIARHSNPASNLLRRPPLINPIHIGQPDRIGNRNRPNPLFRLPPYLVSPLMREDSHEKPQQHSDKRAIDQDMFHAHFTLKLSKEELISDHLYIDLNQIITLD